jgi:hypothetical protein
VQLPERLQHVVQTIMLPSGRMRVCVRQAAHAAALVKSSAASISARLI